MAVDGMAAARTLQNWGPLAFNGACLYFVWLAYKKHGATATGSYQTALAAWHASPGKHEGDRTPPAGVPVWWGARANSSAGDVVISLGDGRVVATDYPVYGVVGTCTIDQREAQIGRPYLGWTETILGAPINYTGATEDKEEDMPTPEEFAEAFWNYNMHGGPEMSGSEKIPTETAGERLRNIRRSTAGLRRRLMATSTRVYRLVQEGKITEKQLGEVLDALDADDTAG